MLLTDLSILELYLRLDTFSKRSRIIAYALICFSTFNACSGVIGNYILKQQSDAVRDRGLLMLWYFNSGLGLPIDFIIWFLPIPMVFRLQNLDRRQRVGLAMTFGLGLMCPATALGRLCVIREASKFKGDQAWAQAYIHILTNIEVGMAISAVSMVTLRPILILFLNWYSKTASLVSKAKSAMEGTRRVIPESESENDAERNLHRVKAAHHADIELGNITPVTTGTQPALPQPPSPPAVVSGAGDTYPGTNHISPGTSPPGTLRTLTGSHVSHEDHVVAGSNIDTISQQEDNPQSESTTCLTGEACGQSEHEVPDNIPSGDSL